MAKKQEPPKPLYPLHHEYMASLENVLQKGSALYAVIIGPVQNVLKENLPPAAYEMVEKALREFHEAKYGSS